jgi:hypothetical protein
MWNSTDVPSLIVCGSWMLEVLILGIVWSRRREGGRFALDDSLRRHAIGLKLFFLFPTAMYLMFSASQHIAPLVYSDSDYVTYPKLLVGDLRYLRDDLARVQQFQVAAIQYVMVQGALCLALFGVRAKAVVSARGGGFESAAPSVTAG